MQTEFWERYRAYRDGNDRERVAVLVTGGGSIEIYYSMSSVRALFRPDVPSFTDPEAWAAAVMDFADSNDLLPDFRDESYVLTNEEGVYYARLRPGEFLFTPERFEDQPDLLEDLVHLYLPAPPPAD